MSLQPRIVPLAEADHRAMPEGRYSHFLIRNVPVMTRVEIGPGTRTNAHTHTNEEQTYYILEGAGILYADDVAYPISAQTAIVIPAGVKHALENTGDTSLSWIMQYLWPGEASYPVYENA
jgi:mannose-6-phosphate isomerase-like protein (cupin superfamily)